MSWIWPASQVSFIWLRSETSSFFVQVGLTLTPPRSFYSNYMTREDTCGTLHPPFSERWLVSRAHSPPRFQCSDRAMACVTSAVQQNYIPLTITPHRGAPSFSVYISTSRALNETSSIEFTSTGIKNSNPVKVIYKITSFPVDKTIQLARDLCSH